jgi:hypothetical protein
MFHVPLGELAWLAGAILASGAVTGILAGSDIADRANSR